MGEDMEDEHSLGAIVYSCDEPIGIPVDVEYRPAAYDVGVREVDARLKFSESHSDALVPLMNDRRHTNHPHVISLLKVICVTPVLTAWKVRLPNSPVRQRHTFSPKQTSLNQ